MIQKDLKLYFQAQKSQRTTSVEQQKSSITLNSEIASYVKESLLCDVANVLFSFKFDETTTSKVQNQYDAYAQHYSKKQNLSSKPLL